MDNHKKKEYYSFKINNREDLDTLLIKFLTEVLPSLADDYIKSWDAIQALILMRFSLTAYEKGHLKKDIFLKYLIDEINLFSNSIGLDFQFCSLKEDENANN